MALSNSNFINIDGEIKVCGSNYEGNLGLYSDDSTSIFVKVRDVINVKQMAYSVGDSFILLNDGTLHSCGNNGYGGLGLGDACLRNVFTLVTGIIGTIKQLSSNGGLSVLLMMDGTIQVCGYNSSGQLGLGHDDYVRTFTTVPDITGVKHVSCAPDGIFLLMENGGLKFCGVSYSGCSGLNVGRGDFRYKVTTFTDVPNITGVKQVSAGSDHTFILMEDGTVKACGSNKDNQLGGHMYDQYLFVYIPITGVVHVTCGNRCTFLLMDDGTIKVCGLNDKGQLGLGHNGTVVSFTTVPDITGVKQVSCERFSSMLLMNDNTIKTCGYNDYGRLGFGDTVDRNVFTDVPNVINIDAKEVYLESELIQHMYVHSVAVLPDKPDVAPSDNVAFINTECIFQKELRADITITGNLNNLDIEEMS